MTGADASTSLDIQTNADVFPTDVSTLLSKWWCWSSLHLSAHCLDGQICLGLPIGYPMADLSPVQWGRHVVWGAARFRTGEKLPRQGWRSYGASNHGCASGKFSIRCALESMPGRCCRQARQMAMAADRSDFWPWQWQAIGPSCFEIWSRYSSLLIPYVQQLSPWRRKVDLLLWGLIWQMWWFHRFSPRNDNHQISWLVRSN